MNLTQVLLVLTLLQVKHFVFDFYWQPPFMWQNKGTFGHPGGIAHAGVHAFATLVLLAASPASWPLAFAIVAAEFVIHYLVDWSKMNINAKFGWECNKSEKFWQLLGLDQLAHQLTYVAIIWAAFTL